MIHTAHRRGEGDEAHFELMAVPQGLFALAASVADAGHQVEILHLGLEAALDSGFDLKAEVRRTRPDLVAVGFHWHHGALDVREAVVAARRGGAGFVLVGGITATLFSDAILRSWPEVDAVVRGDAELPLALLCEVLARPNAANLARVPNLSWRRDGEVVRNRQTYAAGPDDLASLDFSRLELLRHHLHYSGHLTFDPAVASLTAHAIMRRFNLPFSRGCARSCPRCGGAHTALGPPTGRRHGATFVPVDAVVRAMVEVSRRGIDTFYLSCHPADDDPDRYRRLFAAVRGAGLACSLEVEAFAWLPDRPWLQDFARTFPGRRSRIILSPHGSTARRRRLGIGYSDRDLFEVIHAAQELGLALRFHLGVGPGDTDDDRHAVLALARRLRQHGDLVPLLDEVDPGSPWTAGEPTLSRPNRTLDQLVEGSRLRRAHPRTLVDPGYLLDDHLPTYRSLCAIIGPQATSGPAKNSQ